MLGVTNLAGEVVMCVVILAGVERIPIVETGLDLSALVVGDVSCPDFSDLIVVRVSAFPEDRFADLKTEKFHA